MKKLLHVCFFSLLFLFCSGNMLAQIKVGDPNVKINASLITQNKANYPQMERWSKAGVRGGIPFPNRSGFQKFSTIGPGNSATINQAINQMSNSLRNGEKGLITLRNGTYAIDSRVTMKSNVSLQGETRDGVKCIIDMQGGSAFYFSNTSYAGIYSLTINSILGAPKYKWNYSINQNDEVKGNDNISVRMRGSTRNCWLDKVTILNAVRDPLRCAAKHNTFRDLVVDGAHRKAGGAQGYFFIQDSDNLITGCKITHLRHISLQGDNVEFNVVYDNDFRQEVSFHSGDDGNNLIENNRITLPSDMPPVDRKDTVSTPYREARSTKPIYFAIMGPWSDEHRNSTKPNWIYKNECVQFNHDLGDRRPWSDPNIVYKGPTKIALSIRDRINNFPNSNLPAPVGGTLYPIILNGSTPTPTPQPVCTVGASCDDGDDCTVNDTFKQNCSCEGEISQTGISSKNLTPIEDAFIQNGAGINSNVVKVSKDSRVSYLKFDFKNVTTTATELSLSLTVSGDPGSGDIRVYTGSSNWREGNLSTASAPAKIKEVGSINGTFANAKEYTINLSGLKEVAPNRSYLTLIVEQESGNDVSFASSTNATKAPKLTFKSQDNPCGTLSFAEVALFDKEIERNLTIYPNPTSGNVTVTLPSSNARTEEPILRIINIIGVVVKQKVVANEEKSIDFNLEDLSSGIYFLNYISDNRSITKKVVIK